MEEVEQKYERFKEFIRTKSPNVSMTLIAFLQTPLSVFLDLIYEYTMKQKMTDKKILATVCQKIEVNPKDIKMDDMDTLEAYISYFKAVAKIVNS